jgi:hypothetical protein
MSDTPKRDELDEKEFEAGYSALHNATEFWVVFGRGAFAFRFGPYTPVEAGAILTEAIERKLAVTIIGQCGREFDWQLADDLGCWLAGHPQEKTQSVESDDHESEEPVIEDNEPSF